MITRALRVFAFTIALAGAIDPTLSFTARSKPDVALLVGDAPGDSALAGRVAGALNTRFNVVTAPFPAAATVIAGDQLPVEAEQLHSPAFVVLPDRSLPSVEITSLRAPLHAPLNGRVPITIDAQAVHAGGSTLEVTLRSGAVVVDRRSWKLKEDDDSHTFRLELAPDHAGLIRYVVTARAASAPDSAVVDGVVSVVEERWNVFFYDARPSWQSTFVRRALEQDPRFQVTNRVMTSRALSRDAGQPPETLGDAATLEPFDVVVIGAPDALAEQDVNGLEQMLRARAGSAVLLFDGKTPGPIDRLTTITSWRSDSAKSALAIEPLDAGSGSLRASALLSPDRLPVGAAAIARTQPTGKDSVRQTVVWSSPIGAGQLIVIAAPNAWQYRDAATSGFDRFWQSLIGQAAAAAPAPIDVRIAQPTLHAGESTDLVVTLRAAALTQLSAGSLVTSSIAATIEAPGRSEEIRLWPGAAVGQFRGRLRAPDKPGAYRVAVASEGARAEAPFVVAETIRRATPNERDRLKAYARSRSGQVLTSARLGDLPGLLERATRPERRREPRHPFRSTWWMVPFALALSAEWWIRRRAGYR